MTNPAVMALIIVQTLMLSNLYSSCQRPGPRSPAWIWAAAAANDSTGGAAGAAAGGAAGAVGAGAMAGAATAAGVGVLRVAKVQSSTLWTVQKL
jgi:hypothetical protein